MRSLRLKQRGATLTGYALILSTFTAVSLGAIDGLNRGSEAYLTETSADIEAPRELALYDELETIPDTGDNGNDGNDAPTDFDFQFDEDGQFQSDADGLCMTLEPDGKFRQRVCNGSPEQFIEVFTDQATKTSQLRINGQCIGLENNSSNEGTDYVVQPCDEENVQQLFRRNGLAWESATNTDPLMCMDVNAGGGLGEVVHQWGCHGQPNQIWPDPADFVPLVITPPTPNIAGGGIFVGNVPDNANISPDGDFEDNDNVFVFSESTAVLDNPLSVGGVTMPAGTVLCTYIIWYSPIDDADTVADIDFGAPILTAARSRTDLQNTSQFGEPSATYDYNRAWENNDGYNVNGSTLGIDPYAVDNNGDMMRVFVDCSGNTTP